MKAFIKTCPSHEVRIAIAGRLGAIEDACSEFVLTRPLCVTVTPTNFVFHGGSEPGAIVGLINYARFPIDDVEKINDAGKDLAMHLLERLHQRSCSIFTPTQSIFMERGDLAAR